MISVSRTLRNPMKLLMFTISLFVSLNTYSFEIEFMPTFDCEKSFRHHSYCFATQPKEWSERDKNQVLDALDE